MCLLGCSPLCLVLHARWGWGLCGVVGCCAVLCVCCCHCVCGHSWLLIHLHAHARIHMHRHTHANIHTHAHKHINTLTCTHTTTHHQSYIFSCRLHAPSNTCAATHAPALPLLPHLPAGACCRMAPRSPLASKARPAWRAPGARPGEVGRGYGRSRARSAVSEWLGRGDPVPPRPDCCVPQAAAVLANTCRLNRSTMPPTHSHSQHGPHSPPLPPTLSRPCTMRHGSRASSRGPWAHDP